MLASVYKLTLARLAGKPYYSPMTTHQQCDKSELLAALVEAKTYIEARCVSAEDMYMVQKLALVLEKEKPTSSDNDKPSE